MESEIETIRDVRNENITPAGILAYMDRYRAEHPDMKVWLDPETFRIRARQTRVRAVICHEYNPENPFEHWDLLGTFIRTRGNCGPWVSELEPFCNSKFIREYEGCDDLHYTYMSSAIEAAERYGAIAVEVYANRGETTGLVIAGHDEIVKEYGYDNQHSRELAREVLKAEARTFEQWAEGETFSIAVVRDSNMSADEVEYVESLRGFDWEDVLDSCGGYIGYEWAEEGAREMLAPYLGEDA